jgi:hypothetical protein
MSRRTVLVCVVAAAAVAAVAALTRSKRPPSPEPSAPAPAPRDDGGTSARPPEFPPVRSKDDLVGHWVATLQTGADDQVAWAVAHLRTAGQAGRRAVREAAAAAIGANAALVQQGLEFLAASPDADDAEFARRAIASRDTQSTLRAIRILSAAESPLSAASVAAIGGAAESGNLEVRLAALHALAASGDDPAAERAIRVLGETPRGDVAAGVGALEGTKNAKLLAWTAGCFDADADVAVRLSAASVLVASGDLSRVPWLDEVAGTASSGPFDAADGALAVLAKARDEGALARIGATVANRLASPDARITAIRRLAAYPADRTRTFLEEAADEGVDLGVTIEALDALVRGGDASDRARLTRRLTEGDDRAVQAAALVCGRLRRPDSAPALETALRRADLDEGTREFVVRAIVLCGEPRSAETVVRAIAGDHGAYDAQVSMAYNAGAMLGEATPAMREAIGAQVLRALRGEFGTLSGAGLVQALRAAGICCGPEAGPELASRLPHADREVRTNAALALGHVGGADAERDLKAAWWRWADEETRTTVEEAMERVHFGAAGAPR